jgi:hypothetical protein
LVGENLDSDLFVATALDEFFYTSVGEVHVPP